MQLAPHQRTHAIGADHKIAAVSGTVAESDVDTVAAHADVRRLGASNRRAGLLQQGVVNIATQRNHERHAPLSGDAFEHTPVGSAELAAARGATSNANRRRHPQLLDRAHRIGRETQGKTQITGTLRAIVDTHVPSASAQADRGSQAADAGADDQGGAGWGHARPSPVCRS